MNRRDALKGGIAAALAAVGIRAMPIVARDVVFPGGDMGKKTTFFHPDPSVVGVFAIELDVRTADDQRRVDAALEILSSHGANIYHQDGWTFPVYGGNGGLSASSIVYFLVPNEKGGPS